MPLNLRTVVRRRRTGSRGSSSLDAETVELLRSEPELLALADAISETQRSSAPRRPNAVLGLLAATVAIAGAAAIAASLTTTSGSMSIVDRALAAVGTGPVLHMRIDRADENVLTVDLRTGAVAPIRVEVESWSDTQTHRSKISIRRDGTPFIVSSSRPEVRARSLAELAALDPTTATLLTHYRAAVRTGRSTSADPTALQLNHGAINGELRVTSHGKPISWTSSGRDPVWRILELDSVFRFPEVPHASRSVMHIVGVRATPLPLSQRRRLLPTAPAHISSVDVQIVHARGAGLRRTYRALVVSYPNITECVALEPLPQCDYTATGLTAALTATPAVGTMTLLPLPVGSEEGRWLGQLRRNGLFISIRGGSRVVVVTAARRDQADEALVQVLKSPFSPSGASGGAKG